jgi:hypothetical protein
MRRLTLLFLPLALVAAALPATVSAAVCPRLVGVAVLHVDTTSNSGDGTALVRHGGVIQVVEFDSAAMTGPGGELQTTQHWVFDAGTVTLLEHASPHPVGTRYLTINSPVDVIAGGTGNLHYLGLYDLTTDIAHFAVAGRLCID